MEGVQVRNGRSTPKVQRTRGPSRGRGRRPSRMVGVVDGVGRADEPDARAGVRPAPRLVMHRKFVPLRILDRLPVVEDRLLRSLQLREVLARQLHHHGAIDLLRARMPFDDLR